MSLGEEASVRDEVTAEAPRHVLVVDDDADIREVARLTLTKLAHWEVDVASGGLEAVRRARELQPDAIVLDLMMPDLDGLATMQQLQQRSQTRDIPVILLTAKTKARTAEDAHALGAEGIITKPFDPMALPEQIKALLGWTA